MMLRRLVLCCFSLSVLVVSTAISFADDPTSDEFVKMIVELMSNPDPEFRAAGLEQVRSAAKGTASTQLFAAQLSKLNASSQIALLSALADRRDAAARPAILDLIASSKEESVRASAIATLGSLGSPADLPLLVKSLASASGAEQSAARKSLSQLGGDSINKGLATEIKSAAPGVKAELIGILATRRAGEEVETFLAATTDDTAQVRRAAMSALGQIGRPEHVTTMLPGVLKAERGGERDDAERKIVQICSRIGNEDQRGTVVIEAVNKIPAAERDDLLPLMGRVGGKKLINYVGDIASEQDPARRKMGIDALSKWPDATVADKLLEIANKAADPAERRQAFQGYVKISSTRDNRNDKQRLDRMKEAMKAARSPEEQQFVINRTRTAYDVEAVRFILPFIDQPEFTEVACETIVEIAHHREVRDPHKAEFDTVLDKVIASTKDPIVIDRAQRYKRGETWERPKK